MSRREEQDELLKEMKGLIPPMKMNGLKKKKMKKDILYYASEKEDKRRWITKKAISVWVVSAVAALIITVLGLSGMERLMENPKNNASNNPEETDKVINDVEEENNNPRITTLISEPHFYENTPILSEDVKQLEILMEAENTEKINVWIAPLNGSFDAENYQYAWEKRELIGSSESAREEWLFIWNIDRTKHEYQIIIELIADDKSVRIPYLLLRMAEKMESVMEERMAIIAWNGMKYEVLGNKTLPENIDRRIGDIKRVVSEVTESGDVTLYKDELDISVGTKIYSIKDTDERTAITIQIGDEYYSAYAITQLH